MPQELVLITGASSGLGRALAMALAKRGMSLLLVARREEKLKELAHRLPVKTQILSVDLACEKGRQRVIDWIYEFTPHLIINNAGFGLYGPVLSHSEEENKKMVAVNLQAVMELSVAGAHALKNGRKKGTILNIASASAYFSYPTFCVYAATKAFVLRFSEGMDQELSDQGIRILTACPGQIDTAFREVASQGLFQKKTKGTISIEKAVHYLLHQIDNQIPVFIFDWKYKWLIRVLSLFPRKWRQSLLKNSLKERYTRSS